MMDDYRLIADEIAADIAAGHLRAGERLPPQRRFAAHRGIAASTASRVYGELVRRGLATGEVGRGTFVRAAAPAPEPALAEPGGARVDLELNFPTLPDQAELLAAGLTRMLRPDVLAAGLRAIGAAGTAAAREAAAALLARGGWAPEPSQILFAGSGRQAIAAVLAALVRPGERLGVERLTYPVVKGIASRLGIRLVPLAMDEKGLDPDALTEALPLRAVYLQPAVQSPTGATMSLERRARLAERLRTAGVPVIEDSIWGFLRPDLLPVAAFAPEHTYLVDSLSKRLAPGLSVGFVVPPRGSEPLVASALRSGAWTASGYALEAATQWLTDGTAAEIAAAKRVDAERRQRTVSERLAGLRVHGDQCGYHCWWELPDPWRAETFVAAAARRGIAVAPAAAFAVGSGHAPNAVRIALGTPAHDVLESALDVLAGLARAAPEDAAPD
jgi:DNA-binding transcriptional MocR family regulator